MFKKTIDKTPHQQSADRVQKWGELLAELSQTREQQAIDKTNKYFKCYEQLETLAINFDPKQLQSELSSSFESNKFITQTIFFHTIQLVIKDDFKNFILQAFKTKHFLIKPFILLIVAFGEFLCQIPGDFIVGLIPVLVFGLFGLFDLFQDIISRLEIIKWTFLLILILIVFFCFGLLFWYFVELITKQNVPPFFSLLEDELFLPENILITDRRQIKLTELRLLFSELEKLKLEPSLLITRKYDLTVDFKLQVQSNPKFIDLLK